MNYRKVYDQLMERGKTRTPEINDYYELHHIIPKCMGGDNDKENVVRLTYREHFIAHWLLHREYPTNGSLAASFHIMAFGTAWRSARKERGNGYTPSSRQLEEARMAKIMQRTGTKHSKDTKDKISKGNKGKIGHNNGLKFSDETKAKMRAAKLGKKRSDEVKKKISNGKKKQVPIGEGHHRYGTKHSDETKAKMRTARARRESLRSDK